MFGCCGWCCKELGSDGVFLLLFGAGHGVGRVKVSFGIVLRLPARKILDMGGREGVWYTSDALMYLVSVGGGVSRWMWGCALDGDIDASFR